jgi:hypothetical protein
MSDTCKTTHHGLDAWRNGTCLNIAIVVDLAEAKHTTEVVIGPKAAQSATRLMEVHLIRRESSCDTNKMETETFGLATMLVASPVENHIRVVVAQICVEVTPAKLGTSVNLNQALYLLENALMCGSSLTIQVYPAEYDALNMVNTKESLRGTGNILVFASLSMEAISNS